MIGGPDHVEDLIAAYLDAENEAGLLRIEESLRTAGVDVDELRTARETSRLLRSLDTVEAPRSYALTPETLAVRGYSDREIEKILNPRSSWGGLRLRNAAVYVPLAIAAVALMGVALITIGDLSDYVTDRFETMSDGDVIVTVVVEKEVQVMGETVVQTVVVEKEIQRSDSMLDEAPGALGEPGPQGHFGLAGAPGPVQTVLVEKEVIVEVEKQVVVTVVVEKEIQVMGETVVQTVEVEKVVEVAGETVVQTVVVEKEVPITVLVEKIVEVEKVVEVEREVVVEVAKEVVKEVEVEREVEVAPIPTAAPVVAAAEAMVEKDVEPEETATPTEVPCAVLPTTTPTPTGSPTASATPEPTATISPIPTCTPTPTPTPAASPTATPSPKSTVTPTPMPTPSPSPTPAQ